MAMEINSKNLHKHALPLLIIAAVFLAVTVICLAQYQITVSHGLEALFDQKTHPTQPYMSEVGAQASQELNAD